MNKNEKSRINYMTYGMLFGPAIGLALLGVPGLVVGFALGIVFGAALDAWKKRGIQPSRE